MWGRSFTATSVLLAALTALTSCKDSPSEHQVMLGAAASLRAVMPALIKAYTADHPRSEINATFGASGDLRKQVEGGAPIDAVIFASEKPVTDLITAELADPQSRKLLASNTLVLIGP